MAYISPISNLASVYARRSSGYAPQDNNNDTGSPYADNSGWQDTGFYPEDQMRGEMPFMQDWRNRIFRDQSWLPNAPGRVAVVPAPLIYTPGNDGGYRLPPGYGISPQPYPPFTPPGQRPVPAIGIVPLPRPQLAPVGPAQREEGFNPRPRYSRTIPATL